MKNIVIFDLDGTLSDATERRRHLAATPPDWNSFYEELEQDPPIVPIADLYRSLCRDESYTVVILTGRPERYRSHTERWLETHKLPQRPIYFRPDDDNGHDLDVKKRVYHALTANGDKVAFVVEDRNSVVQMWRELGVVCLHCFDAPF